MLNAHKNTLGKQLVKVVFKEGKGVLRETEKRVCFMSKFNKIHMNSTVYQT